LNSCSRGNTSEGHQFCPLLPRGGGNPLGPSSRLRLAQASRTVVGLNKYPSSTLTATVGNRLRSQPESDLARQQLRPSRPSLQIVNIESHTALASWIDRQRRQQLAQLLDLLLSANDELLVSVAVLAKTFPRALWIRRDGSELVNQFGPRVSRDDQA
jgi:hypothetical protein